MQLPGGVEVMGVQYPGREARLNETPFDRMEDLVAAVAQQMVPLLDRSFVIYGHSMGGLVAYEVTRYLQENYDEIPVRLIIGGWAAPYMVPDYVRNLAYVRDGFDIDAATDAQVIEMMHANRLFQEEALRDPTFINAVMRSVRADLKILGRYQFDDRERLRCPITLLRGSEDTLFDNRQLQGWRQITAAPFAMRTVPGGHLFLKGAGREVFAAIEAELGMGSFPRFSQVVEAVGKPTEIQS